MYRGGEAAATLRLYFLKIATVHNQGSLIKDPKMITLGLILDQNDPNALAVVLVCCFRIILLSKQHTDTW
jgi:hypothetical protein